MSIAPGFAQHASGLYVPEEHKRDRETWTYEQWRMLDKAIKLLESRGIEMFLRCPDARCAAPMERIRNLDGGIMLRCNHLDRVVTRFRK